MESTRKRRSNQPAEAKSSKTSQLNFPFVTKLHRMLQVCFALHILSTPFKIISDFIFFWIFIVDSLTNVRYQDKDCTDYIAWSADGNMFHIIDATEFSEKVLPRYFKHNKYSSFVRLVRLSTIRLL